MAPTRLEAPGRSAPVAGEGRVDGEPPVAPAVATSTLFFLHGLTIDGRDARVLARALPELEVRAVPLPGHEAPPVDDWSPRALAAGLVATLPATPAVLVGHSWGAAIALHLAALVPARVSALVLLDGGWFDRADLPRRAAPRDPHQAAALAALFATASSSAWPALASARVPTLAIAGAADTGEVKRALLARFATAVPHADTMVFDDLGHDLLRDAPGEVAHAIAGWLGPGIAARAR